MASTSWNDAEDEALRCLPWRARVVYLQGIRRHMDFNTGWSGKARVLSHQFFHELLESAERTTAPDPRVTKDGLRAIFTMLERVGLVEWQRGSAAHRGAIFRCVLADVNQSVQKQDAPKTHPRRAIEDAPNKPSNDKACVAQDAPKTHPSLTGQDAPPQVFRNQEKNPPTGDKERGATSAVAQAKTRGTRLSLAAAPDGWLDWCCQERPDLEAARVWEDFRDYWVAVPGSRGVKIDWLATWRRWVRRESVGAAADKRCATGHGGKGQRIAEANRKAGDDFVSGAATPVMGSVIEGEFRRVR